VNEIKNRNSLVSVIVITYNSAKYILETLESAKAQSYQNIELIVSDDCSTDDTIKICKNWISENKNRFVRTKFITVKKNTGISSNCNRGLFAAKGKWVKQIAGDDILLPNCIDDNIEFTRINKKAKFIFSTYRYLINGKISSRYYFRRSFYKKNNIQQIKTILKGIGVNSPTCFISRIDLIKLGGYNENYEFLEDAPLWLKASSKGYKLYAFESCTVIYRIHAENSCLSNGTDFINLKYYDSQKKFYNQIVKNQLVNRKNYLTLLSNFVDFKIKDYVISKGNKKTDYNLFLKFLNIFNINNIIGFNGYFNIHNDYKTDFKWK